MADDTEAKAVTGRPNDIPVRDPEPAPLGGNSRFADRAKARGVKAKAVEGDDAENKAVSGARTKRK
jgi:hypothetical protein